ncbi:MAG: hypothetical protein LBP63_02460 [Prevotellaceae bacterium]|nr:hypothetical protein [Prevotellaceae bacterium]
MGEDAEGLGEDAEGLVVDAEGLVVDAEGLRVSPKNSGDRKEMINVFANHCRVNFKL